MIEKKLFDNSGDLYAIQAVFMIRRFETELRLGDEL